MRPRGWQEAEVKEVRWALGADLGGASETFSGGL